ncbi:PLP-dependent lyase/thiolase [Candidatus Woesearchaeota archaeon]|nr:PLP-dependent lyase/thiolase [Candidatus Woesearchaeota archaeon]
MNSLFRTPLTERKDLAEIFEVPRLFVKDESANPTGTIKDRKALQYWANSLVVCLTNGNMGYSLATLVNRPTKIINVVDKTIDGVVLAALRKVSIVVQRDLSRPITEAALRAIGHRYITEKLGLPRKITEKLRLPQNTPFAIVAEFGTNMHAYSEVTEDIMEYFLHSDISPTNVTVAVPLGGGELMENLLYCPSKHPSSGRYKTSFKTIGVTSRNVLPLPSKKVLTPWPLTDPYVPDKLRTAYISTEILRRISQNITEGTAEVITGISLMETKRAYDLLQQHGIRAEPSAAIAFAGLWRKKWNKDDVACVVNTGEGIYNRQHPFPKAT